METLSPHGDCRCIEVWSDKQTVESLIVIIGRLICELRTLKETHPELKLGYQLSPGGILNAYREGDVTFEEAVRKIEELKLEMPT